MNEKKAKKLRRKVYGDTSLKVKREYILDTKSGVIFNAPGSKRAIYQGVKRGSLSL